MTVQAPQRPLRIGQVTPAWPGVRTPNGIATAVSHLAAGLERAEDDVTIIARRMDAERQHPRVIRSADDLHWVKVAVVEETQGWVGATRRGKVSVPIVGPPCVGHGGCTSRWQRRQTGPRGGEGDLLALPRVTWAA